MKEKMTILVVDDDHAHRTMLSTLISAWGYTIEEADDGTSAIEKVQDKPFDLVLMDIRMLKMSGIEALDKIKAYNPAIPVIIMTAYSSVETAVDALKKGAYDYLTKPLDFEKMRFVIERAMEHGRLTEENRKLKVQLGKNFDDRNIIGRGPLMKNLMETVAQVAPSDVTVLITGKSGTGKELIANALHYNSLRKQGPFIKINCAAITETLLESELFGHEKGAFTGADRKKDGCFQRAHGGSLFLDEISEMPLNMQVKLLRVLQEREVTRVGGDTVIPIDTRVLAATNKDLLTQVEGGAFREDLYYRLNVVGLRIPSLNERQEDIPILAQHFLEAFIQKNNKEIKGFTPAAMDLLIHYDWPGNVRELMNLVERAVVLTRSPYLDVEDLHMPVEITSTSPEKDVCTAPSFQGMSLDQVEKSAILNTLDECKGNKSETARRLGITRRTLHKKLKTYGVMRG